MTNSLVSFSPFLFNTKTSIITCFLQTEQEITGDVLLELDVNLLKIEIGIMAFGKRMRIANAITDLRRPPSIQYSDHQSLSMQLQQSNSVTHLHSRTQSQSLSLPGTATVGHAHSYSIQSSLGSPVAGHGGQQSSHVQDSPVDINDDVKAAAALVGLESSATPGVAAGMSAAAGVGLGIALSSKNATSFEVSSLMKNICAYIYFVCFKKGPPSRLVLSPSTGALKESAARTAPLNGEDEDHGHMNDVRLKSLHCLGSLTSCFL